jgi:hypothetical protein
MPLSDLELAALIAPLVAHGWPPEKATLLLSLAAEHLDVTLDVLPTFVERCTREAPITHGALLLHLVNSTTLFGSLEGCLYLAKLGAVAVERLCAMRPPDNEPKQ